MIEMELQRFADEGGMEGGMDAGMADAGAEGQQADAGESGGETFEELIKGRYKDEYQQHMQAAISRRFKNQRDREKQFSTIAQTLGQKYGVDPKDYEGIAKRLTDDDSLYADEANRLGLPVSTVKRMKQLEAENRNFQAEQQQSREEAALQEHFRRISQQAEELKQTFPAFDLMTEIRSNPRFARMTSPQIGMSVKDAFYAIHGEEIRQQTMQAAAQQAGQRLAASVQAGAGRPVENGIRGGMPMQMGVDIAHMDRKTREDIRRRIHQGEAGIDFRSKL